MAANPPFNTGGRLFMSSVRNDLYLCPCASVVIHGLLPAVATGYRHS